MGRNPRHGLSDSWKADEGALESIVKQLNGGADDIDEAVKKELRPVDAGVSSDVVGEAVSAVIKMATAVANTMSTAAENVNTAQGSYDEVENNNKGKIELQRQEMEGSSPRTHHTDRGNP